MAETGLRSFILSHVLIVTLAFWLAAPALAQVRELTADELLNRGVHAYSQGDFASSRDAFEQFLENYGASQEAAQAVHRARPLLALSLVKLGQLQEAREIIETAQANGSLRPEIAEELLFWRGVCEFDAKDFGPARETFRAFSELFPRSSKRLEALILLGTTLVLEDKHKAAAEQFSSLRKMLKGFDRGRVVILELNSLLTEGQLDTARDLALREYRQMDDILQLVAFQTLMLNLGSRFLEAGRYTDAVACLQLIWSRERLLMHQTKRLKVLQDRLTAARQRKSGAYQQLQLGQMIAKVKREVEGFREIESFDAAVRMRLARAFQMMPRYREAALVLEAMLEELAPDAVVEKASVNLVQCWIQTENWQRAVIAARQFESTFPDSKELPLVLFMKGQAQQNGGEYSDSVITFDGIVRKQGTVEISPSALFMAGFSELLREDYAAALDRFEALPEKYPDSPVVEKALYWKGMALSLAKEHARSRDVMQAYLDDYGKDARHSGAATFRRAYSAQSMKDYGTSIPEMEAFLRNYPGHELRSEALLLLGDALVTTGYLDEGISRYTQIPSSDTKFFEEGWFKVGKALRLQENHAELRVHMEKFRTEHPKSARTAEAVYWIGWTHLQNGDEEKARDIYWTTIEELGNDPNARSVDDLFDGLRRLYRSEESRAELQGRMARLLEEADAEGRGTLAVRTLWAQAKQMERESPTRAQYLFLAGATRVDVQTASPRLLADFADALLQAGDVGRAREMYRDLVKWNPRALERDRAFAGLAQLAMLRGELDEAMEYLERFERETAESPLLGKALLAKADLLFRRNRDTESDAVLNQLLETETVGSREKAQGLLMLGELHMKRGSPEKAIPYYQRIFVMYRRWHEYVAPAYLRSGEAFEQIGDLQAAIRTYEELAGDEAFSEMPEAKAARERLKALVSHEDTEGA